MNTLKTFLNTYKTWLLVIVPVLLILTLALTGTFKWGSVKIERERYITVTGTSQTQKVNEIATFNATVSVIDVDKVKAVNLVNERSQKVVDALKTFGIDQKDLKTTNMTVYQDQEAFWDNGVQKFRPGNWRADISVEIILRDITKASALSDLLANQETTNIYGPNFALDTSKDNAEALLSSALQDAKQKAVALAQTSGKVVGELISVVEGTDYAQPLMYKAEGMGGGGVGAPLEPGSTTVSKTVTATYKLE